MQRFFVAFLFLVTSLGSIFVAILAIHYDIIDYRYGINIVAGSLMLGMLFSLAVKAMLEKKALEAHIVAALSGSSIFIFCLGHLLNDPLMILGFVLLSGITFVLPRLYLKYRQSGDVLQ